MAFVVTHSIETPILLKRYSFIKKTEAVVLFVKTKDNALHFSLQFKFCFLLPDHFFLLNLLRGKID